MTNQTKAKTPPVNSLLLLFVGLLVGFIAGYAISHQGAPPGTAAIDAASRSASCPHELAAGDRHILEGFICPSPQCTDPVLDCHCETAHQIKDRVKQLLAEGKPPEEVRAEVKEQYKM